LLQAKIVASRLIGVSASSTPYLKDRMSVAKLGRCSWGSFRCLSATLIFSLVLHHLFSVTD